MPLADYSTETLLAELVRRRNAEEVEAPIDHLCETCVHFKCTTSDKANPCQKRHVMLFKTPDESNWPDPHEWGYYRRACPDFEAAPEPEPPIPRPRTYQELCEHNERLLREAAGKSPAS